MKNPLSHLWNAVTGWFSKPEPELSAEEIKINESIENLKQRNNEWEDHLRAHNEQFDNTITAILETSDDALKTLHDLNASMSASKYIDSGRVEVTKSIDELTTGALELKSAMGIKFKLYDDTHNGDARNRVKQVIDCYDDRSINQYGKQTVTSYNSEFVQ